MNPMLAYMRTYSFAPVWACFIIPTALLFGAVLLPRIYRRHGWGTTLSLLLGVPLGVGMMAWLTTSSRTVVHAPSAVVEYSSAQHSEEPLTMAAPAATAAPAVVMPPIAEALPEATTSTTDTSEGFFADRYPSMSAAAAAVTRQALRSLDKVIPDGDKLGLLEVENGTAEIAELVAATARQQLPGVEVVQLSAQGEAARRAAPPDGEVRASLKLDTSAQGARAGYIALSLVGPTGSQVSFHANAVDKPWVDDAKAGSSNGRGYRIVVHSDLWADAGSAQHQALERAVQQLRARAEQRLAREGPIPANGAQVVTEGIRDDLHRRGWIKDTFQQRITRPFGEMWRTSLLVVVDDPDMAYAAREYRMTWEGRQRGTRSTILAALGLGLGIVILYLFLNAATKGYYMWPLRIVGVVAVAAGVFVVLRMA